MIPTFLLKWYAPNHTGRAVPIDPLETAAATLARHGAELRRQARQQTTADRHAVMRAMQGDPTLRPALADVEAELAPLFARLDMRDAARKASRGK